MSRSDDVLVEFSCGSVSEDFSDFLLAMFTFQVMSAISAPDLEHLLRPQLVRQFIVVDIGEDPEPHALRKDLAFGFLELVLESARRLVDDIVGKRSRRADARDGVGAKELLGMHTWLRFEAKVRKRFLEEVGELGREVIRLVAVADSCAPNGGVHAKLNE